MPPESAQSLDNLRLERDAVLLYDALAEIEKDAVRAAAFRRIAANERRHADIWARKLEERGTEVPPRPTRPRPRVAVIILLARLFGTKAVSDLVTALEGDEEEIYESQSSPEVAAIAADEREHAEIWQQLKDSSGSATATDTARAQSKIAARERWHRTGRSGTLRAVIFGVSDGLVSNLALVMGVAGAAGEQGRFILLAGIAGLLAGAFSMAAGEYISMQSQRELFERQIALERDELETMPEEERAEVAALYRAKGFHRDEAEAIATRLLEDPERALDTLVREELGLDPDQLGSPIGAAVGSFIAFGVGAAIPVVPYALATGAGAFFTSLALSLAALFAVGAGDRQLTISNQARDRVKGVFEPIALALGRLGLTPDALTLIGFAITGIGAGLVALQYWTLGGVVVFVGGVFDMFDGTLARATGRVSRIGAFMDAVFDRWGEAIVYLGIVAGAVIAGHERVPILAAAAMGAAFMVSYVRAKSEGLGFTEGTGMAAVGIMPREVRLVILALGLILTDGPNIKAIEFALAIIAIGSTITTIQRILHVRAQANREATGRPTEQEHT